MSLRKRIVVIVGVATVSLIAILNVLSHLILVRSFARLEQEYSQEQAQRALASLEAKLDALDTFLFDWAAWDDTYTFVRDVNLEYVETNLVDETFSSAGLNLMLFIDTDSQLVFGKAFDLENQLEMPIPGDVYRHLELGDPLVSHTGIENAVHGVVILSGGPMLVASRPILTSEEEGPIRGTMIMGVYLETIVQHLAETARLSLSVYPFSDPRSTQDAEIIEAMLSSEQPVLTRPQDAETITVYALVRDVYDQPGVVVTVDVARDIYRQGQATLVYVSTAVAIIGLVFGGIVLWVLERVVLFRLTQLGQNVNDIGISGDVTRRVIVTGNDELSALARAVNAMLASLHEYQRKLVESETQFRLLFEQSPLAIEIFGLDGALLQVNPAWEAMWNADSKDVVGRHNALQNEQIAELGLLPLLERAFAGESVRLPDTEFDPARSGLPGQKRWVRSHVYHLRDEAGYLKNVVLLHEDITARKQAGAALEESEERFRQLAETIREVFWIGALDWSEVLYISPAYEEVWGRSCQSLYEKPFSWLDAVVQEDRPMLAAFLNTAIDTLASSTCVPGIEFPEYRIVRPDGSVCWILARAFAIRDEQDRVCRIAGITEDITARKHAEQRLQESELRYRTLFENAPVGIGLATLDGQVLVMNQAMQRMTGYSMNDVKDVDLGGTYQDPQERERLVQWLERDGLVRDFEVVLKRKDGTPYDASLTVTPITLDEQRIVMTVAEDITERKRAEAAERELTAKLERARRMESLGTLAGGVAHDLNNILGPLVAYPDLILLDLPANSTIRSDVQQIQQAAGRAAVMVQDLLTLARRGAYQMVTVDLNAVVHEYLASPSFAGLKARGSNVVVETDLSPDLLNVSGSVPHLSKVIMNLVTNAMEAMPHGGQLTIQTANRSLDRALVGYEYIDPGDYVALCVRDTGVGIQPDDISRIFEPFYTKKKMGRSGSGLGLSVVHGVVHDHKGKINLHTEVGVGTEFVLYFPITYDVISQPTDDRQVYGGTETVLVVDDLPDQRALVVRLLSSLGYQVNAVESGRAAIDYLQTHSADILVLDMIMEDGFDGLDTYRQIIERHPGQKAVIASGFSETGRVKEVQQLGAGPFIRKPYTLASIGKAIRQELDQGK